MTDEATSNEEEASGESAVIKALRSQVKDQGATIKSFESRPDRETERAEFLAEQARGIAIGEHLVALGQPAGLSELLGDKVEGDVTLEKVTAVLTGLGYEAQSGDGDEATKAVEQSALAEVTTLSSAVSSATAGAPAGDLAAKIAGAENAEDLAKVMAEADLTGSHI